jgi:hypothetical protein
MLAEDAGLLHKPWESERRALSWWGKHTYEDEVGQGWGGPDELQQL